MKRPPRPVILADVKTSVVALRAVDNGSGFLGCDVRALALAAGLEPRFTTSTVWIGLSELLDLEALAEYRGVVVQRTGRKL